MSTQGFKRNWHNSALEVHKSALKAQQYLAPLGLHREWKLATAAGLSAEQPREGNVLTPSLIEGESLIEGAVRHRNCDTPLSTGRGPVQPSMIHWRYC